MNWVIKQILHRHLMQLLCHHLLWLSNQLSLPLFHLHLKQLFHQHLPHLESLKAISLFTLYVICVSASTSALVGWSSTTNLLYLMASHKTCCTCLQATKLAVSICSLATWYWAEGGRFAPLL
nr:uncharacterized protein LOC124806107 isoform X15 [Hydra vulgaris]